MIIVLNLQTLPPNIKKVTYIRTPMLIQERLERTETNLMNFK